MCTVQRNSQKNELKYKQTHDSFNTQMVVDADDWYVEEYESLVKKVIEKLGSMPSSEDATNSLIHQLI